VFQISPEEYLHRRYVLLSISCVAFTDRRGTTQRELLSHAMNHHLPIWRFFWTCRAHHRSYHRHSNDRSRSVCSESADANHLQLAEQRET
jgi:hypothetical protein